jgi:hypothetical protein
MTSLATLLNPGVLDLSIVQECLIAKLDPLELIALSQVSKSIRLQCTSP